MTVGADGGAGSEPLTEEQERALQQEYREKVRAFDQLEDDLRAARTFQRIFLLTMFGAIALAFLLGYTVVVGLWKEQPIFTRYVGLVIVLMIWVAAGWALWRNRKRIVEASTTLRNAALDRQAAAAKLPLDSPSGLRIYREASLDLISQYRKGAATNRRVHNFFQIIIITGSIVTSTLAATNDGSNMALRVITSALSALVGISAGITGYFKFRERGYNLQSTADDIEKHYNASQFMLDDYAGTDPSQPPSEQERLRMFARFVERLKEEQRKRELQLEQQSAIEERSA